MRLLGRCRPAGVEQVPSQVLAPEIVAQPLGPVVLRLGPGGGLLDLPGRSWFDSVSNVWLVDGSWAEAMWPRDPAYRWFIAPIDLRLGHILEFRAHATIVCGWVADVQHDVFVFVVTTDRVQAAEIASIALARHNTHRIERLL